MTNPSTVSLPAELATADLEKIVGGVTLDPNYVVRQKGKLLAQCGPQIDAFTTARKASAADPTDTRKEIDAATAGRSLAVCSMKAGYEPVPSWRYASPNAK